MESLESLESLAPREVNSCTGAKQWYVCTAGNFRGCCSSDPCTTGICPDSDEDDSFTFTMTKLPKIGTPKTITTSSTSTSSESTAALSTDSSMITPVPSPTVSFITSETSTSSKTPLVTLTTSEISISSDTSMALGATGITALSSVAAASPSSASSNTGSAASPNLGAIIGGVVGGVAVLVICAILLFCCRRHKRKYGKRENGSTLVSWYPYGLMRKDRATASEMKGALSPSDSEANNPSSAVSPFTTDSTRASTILIPDPTVVSSSTSLISHSRCQTSPGPPNKAHTNELFASVPSRQGFTPELQDTGFHRLRAELASYSQRELINIPMEQRQRQQNHIKSRTGPRVWEPPALAPIASPHASRRGTDNGRGHSHSNSNGGSPGRNQAGRVITAEGVVLGANLDRYSNGMEVGQSQAQGERGRKVERGETDHVMSFMQYGGRPEDRGLGNGLGIATGDDNSNPQARGNNASRSRPRPGERSLEDDTAAAEGNADVPPAYEAEDGVPGPDIKSPSGTMALAVEAAIDTSRVGIVGIVRHWSIDGDKQFGGVGFFGPPRLGSRPSWVRQGQHVEADNALMVSSSPPLENFSTSGTQSQFFSLESTLQQNSWKDPSLQVSPLVAMGCEYPVEQVPNTVHGLQWQSFISGA
ncbi:Adenovirus E3 region protein CR2 [Penicillium cf. griseofulvum]|uniref:Adenovirus E3 region protein CR2 n=1 Tax=Penicillium cf. griseofulvum TaxID=2972120 RepID=A0A9W9MZL2_9EURO|nr:Adenovirus E3 region protein CR2 [Penicillium cf. griseofulvum]KAJ5421871.1 Adenovirus E3 region protein CR2 [Penicillium cf. griseofulvum]KAJ5428062.1 Adenovirus E3 region protein CR2 [Penicillium cf. griseofulvum]